MVAGISQKKIGFVDRVEGLLSEYDKVIVFNADNVSSTQLKSVRKNLYGKGEIVMGKNTLFRKAFAKQFEKKPSLQKIVGQLVGNVGICFTNDDLRDCREVLEVQSEAIAAKPGQVAQVDVTLNKGVTSISPDKTSFFQSLNISTMINKGFIEILSDVPLLKKGNKVGESEATLLSMLSMKPFNYKLSSVMIYENGSVYSPSILDITKEDIIAAMKDGITNVRAVSLGLGHTTKASAAQSLMDTFKSLMGACLEFGYENDRTKAFEQAAASASAVAAVQATSTQAATQEVKQEEPEEEEEDEDLGLSLFD